MTVDLVDTGTCESAPPDAGDVGTCAIEERTATVSWEAPRSRGLEIRLFGVTKCFGTDGDGAMIDGRCLREHTTLPSSAMTLLAKAPASKGRVEVRMVPSGRGLADTTRGVAVYSFVLGAYDAAGHESVMAIAATESYCTVARTACESWDGITMVGEAATGDRPGRLELDVTMVGLAPAAAALLEASARYSADWTCGEAPCEEDGLCGPGHVETTTGGATATVRKVADAAGRVSAHIRLVAPPPTAACPVDPDAPWYGGGERWTRITLMDRAHELELAPDDVIAEVVY